jgi:hypothetical protein
MGNTNSRHLAKAGAALLLITAAPALGQSVTITVPGLTPAQVSENIITRCSNQSGTLENVTERQVVCMKMGNVVANLLFGTRGGQTMARQRYILMPAGPDTRVIVSLSLDTTNVYGGSRSEPQSIQGANYKTLVSVLRGELPGLPHKAVEPAAAPSQQPATTPPTAEGPPQL